MPAGALEAVAAAINRARPEFAKTGTGYGRGATVEDTATLRRLLDPSIKIKAAGGIRTRAQALSLLDAGADRIGTSRAREILDEN